MTRRYIALTPEQKELKKQWLFEQGREQAEDLPPSFEEFLEDDASIHMLLNGRFEELEIDIDEWDAQYRVGEEYDDEDIEELAREEMGPQYDEAIARAEQALAEAEELVGYVEDMWAALPDDDPNEPLYEQAYDEAYEELERAETTIEQTKLQRQEAIEKMIPAVREELENKALEELRDEAWEKAKEEFEEYYDEAMAELEEIKSGESYYVGKDVYRVVVLERSVDPQQLQGVGRFWTTEKEFARNFGTGGRDMKDPVVWRFRARLDPENVDVADTLHPRVWGSAMDNMADATEVRFYKHSPLFVYDATQTNIDPDWIEELQRAKDYGGEYEWDLDPWGEEEEEAEVVEINDWRRA